MKICEQCGRSYSRKLSKSKSEYQMQRFCSKKCANLAKRKANPTTQAAKKRVDWDAEKVHNKDYEQHQLNKQIDNKTRLHFETKVYTKEEIAKIAGQITPIDKIRDGLIGGGVKPHMYGVY